MPQNNRSFASFRKFTLAFSSLLLIAAISVSAQLPTGTFLGVVKDTTGGSVAGATVTISNVDTGLNRTVTTGDDGSYRAPALPVGNYIIRIMKDGFQTVERKGLTLQVTQEAAVDVTLQVGSTGQTVTVTEEAPQVNTTGSSLGGTVDEQKIEDLPLNGRNYVDLTIMQAGVTQTSITTGPYGMNGTMFSSNGATLRSNTTLLDGAIMTTLMGVSAGSIIGTSLGVDGIKEYKVVTVLPSAEYGLVMGSQTALVSKGGTNSWHGDAFEYMRNSALDARNYFDALDSTNFYGFGTNKSISYPGKRIPPYNRNNFGGSFGGPIQKDKTFFYGVYEGVREVFSPTTNAETFNKGCFYGSNTSSTGPFTLNSTIPLYINNTAANPFGLCQPAANVGTRPNPTPPPSTLPIPNNLITVGCPIASISPTGCLTTPQPLILQLASLFPQPNVAPGLSFNYTFPFKQPAQENYYQLRMDHTFSGKDSIFARYTVDTVNQFTAGNYPAFRNRNRSGAYIGTIGETHILTPTVLNTARFSFSRTALNLALPTVPFATNAVLVAGLDASTGINPGSSVTAFGTSGNTNGDISQNVYSVSDDIFWTKGKNAFKFGTMINAYAGLYKVNIFDRGAVAFGSNTDFFAGNWNSVSGRAADGQQTRLWHWKTLGFYAQDDYRLSSRLTLNLGLRYEFMTTMTAPPGLAYTIANVRTDATGIAAPLFLDSSYHNFSPRVGFAWDVFGDGKTSLRGGTGIYYDLGSAGSEIAGNGSGDPTLSKLIAITSTGTAPPFVLTASPNCFTPMCTTPLIQAQVTRTARVADYHMPQPSMGQWNLTLDRQLPWGMAFTAAYVGTKGWHIKQTTEGNPTKPIGYLANGLPYYCTQDGTLTGLPATATTQCLNSNFQGRTNTVYRDANGKLLDKVQYYTATGDSYYHALQTSLNMRARHGLQFQLNYTFAKNLDDGQKVNSDSGSGAVSGQTVDQLWSDKGPSFVDIRHNIRANMVYHAPNFKSDRLWAAPLHGWWFGTVLSLQTGFPINPLTGTDRALQNNGGVSTRPNLDASFNADKVTLGTVQRWFDPTMFDLQPAGQLGNAGRNMLRGPKLRNVDLSINKDTHVKWLGEGGTVQFRAEMFNIFNHPNFLAPSGSMWANPGSANIGKVAAGQFGSTGGPAILSTAGRITDTTTKSRQIQFALKLVF